MQVQSRALSLPAFIRANERENALFLAENELLAPAAAREGAVLAAEMGDAELSARLARAGGAAAEDDFDLEISDGDDFDI